VAVHLEIRKDLEWVAKRQGELYHGANLVTPPGSIGVIWVDCIDNFLDNQKHLITFGEHFSMVPSSCQSSDRALGESS